MIAARIKNLKEKPVKKPRVNRMIIMCAKVRSRSVPVDLGRGFLKGTQTRGKYVPEQHTDFIFTSLGEAFGFLGCFIFLVIYLFMLYRIIKMAERQRSTFSRVYAYSVASILFFHIAVNVSMTIGLFPIVGIPCH
jgi:rod shape determining protein RodA